MQVVVKGKNLDVPQHVKDDAVQKLTKVRKLFDRFIDMEITFSEDHNPRISEPYHCEVVLHAKGKYIRASAAAADPGAAVDLVEAKLARQVRKYKTKVVDRGRHLDKERLNGEIGPADFVTMSGISEEE